MLAFETARQTQRVTCGSATFGVPFMEIACQTHIGTQMVPGALQMRSPTVNASNFRQNSYPRLKMADSMRTATSSGGAGVAA